MAIKKRTVSDLLRQEAQKLPDVEEKSAIDTTAVEVVENEAEWVEVSLADKSAQNSVEDNSPTRAELEATIAELKAALDRSQKLEISQQHEVSLQQQVIDLQSELTAQKKLVQKLQKDVEEVDSLKAELKKTKKEALQLAEANSKLIEEKNTAKTDKDKEAVKTDKDKEAVTLQRYIPIERKIGKTLSEEGRKAADFANNTWLLD